MICGRWKRLQQNFLNHSKSEIICADSNTRRAMLDIYPDLQPVDPQNITLLGSHFGDFACIDDAIKQKIHSLSVLQDRLGHFQGHNSLCLLQHAFSAPKLLYLLYTRPPAFLLMSSQNLIIFRNLCLRA